MLDSGVGLADMLIGLEPDILGRGSQVTVIIYLQSLKRPA